MAETNADPCRQELAFSLTDDEHQHVLEVSKLLDPRLVPQIAETPPGQPIRLSESDFLEFVGFLGAEVVFQTDPARSEIFMDLLKRIEGLIEQAGGQAG